MSTITLRAALAQVVQAKPICRMFRRQPSTTTRSAFWTAKFPARSPTVPGAPHQAGVVVLQQVVGVESGGHGQAEGFRELTESVHSPGDPDASAGEQDGPLGPGEELEERGDPRGQGGDWRCFRLEAAEGIGIDPGPLDVRGHIDPDGTGSPAGGEVERLLQVEADVLRALRQRRVLGQGPYHGHDVHFLVPQLAEPLGTGPGHQGLALHLAADDDQAQAVGPGPVDPRQGVEPAGARGHVDGSQLAGEAEVALRRDGAGLLVVAADHLEVPVPAEGVVEVHGAAPGHHEDMPDAVFGQAKGDVVGDTDHGTSSWRSHARVRLRASGRSRKTSSPRALALEMSGT